MGDVHEWEYDRSRMTAEEKLKHEETRAATIKKHTENVKEQREKFELLNEKRLAEQGKLPTQKFVLVDGKNVSASDQGEQIGILASKLKAAMQQAKNAIQMAKKTRTKANKAEAKEKMEVGKLSSQLKVERMSEKEFRRSVIKQIRRLKSTQDRLVEKVSEARSKAGEAKQVVVKKEF